MKNYIELSEKYRKFITERAEHKRNYVYYSTL